MFLLSTLLSIPYPFTTLSKSDVKEKKGEGGRNLPTTCCLQLWHVTLKPHISTCNLTLRTLSSWSKHFFTFPHQASFPILRSPYLKYTQRREGGKRALLHYIILFAHSFYLLTCDISFCTVLSFPLLEQLYLRFYL